MNFDDKYFLENVVEFSYSNPATYWKIGILNEGLTRTYNPKTTFSYVSKALNGEIKMESCKDYKMVIITKPEHINELEKCMACCGYYQNKPVQYNNNKSLVRCYYAAKYTRNNTLEGIDTLYHFAPKYLEDKILQNGFVPKSKNNYFNYPGRVHFFYGDYSDSEIYRIGDGLCSSNMNNMNNGEYVLFILDANKIHDNIRFQQDQDWLGHAVFTYDNISPNTIMARKYFTFNNPKSGFKTLTE